MNHALINVDGYVENIIVWDDESDWTPPDGYTVIKSDIAEIGWQYKNGEFQPPRQSQTHEELVKLGLDEKESRLAFARNYIGILQTKLLLGRITDDEKHQLNEWLDYIDAVTAIDTSAAPYIQWPEQPT